MLLAMPLTKPDINPSAARAIYEQAADHIAAAIESGELAPGEKLPPERDLAYDWGIGYGTLRRAYEVLRERGLIESRQGKGTFVAGPEE